MKKLLSLGFSQYLALATQLITGPLLARALGPEGRGQLATLLVLYMVSPIIVGFGSQASFRRLVALRMEAQRAYSYLSTHLLIGFVASLFIAILIVWFLNEQSSMITWAVVGLMLTSGLANYRNSVVSGAIALGDISLISRNSILNALIALAGIGILYASGWLSVSSAVIVYGLSTIASTVPPLKRLRWETETVWVKPKLRYSLGSIPGQLGEVALIRVDQIIVALLLGMSTAGYYAVAFSYAFMLYPLMHSLAVNAAAGSKVSSKVRHRTGSVLTKIIAVGLGAALLMVLLSGTVVTLLFGAEFTPSIVLSRVLIFTVLVMGVSSYFMQINNSDGKAQINSISSLVGMLIIVASSVMLVPNFGSLGVAFGSLIGCVVHLSILILVQSRNPPANRRQVVVDH